MTDKVQKLNNSKYSLQAHKTGKGIRKVDISQFCFFYDITVNISTASS